MISILTTPINVIGIRALLTRDWVALFRLNLMCDTLGVIHLQDGIKNINHAH